MPGWGRKGGKASVRSRLDLDRDVADDRLRAKAKARLEALLDSEDEGSADGTIRPVVTLPERCSTVPSRPVTTKGLPGHGSASSP